MAFFVNVLPKGCHRSGKGFAFKVKGRGSAPKKSIFQKTKIDFFGPLDFEPDL
jgi:hypothetical protein